MQFSEEKAFDILGDLYVKKAQKEILPPVGFRSWTLSFILRGRWTKFLAVLRWSLLVFLAICFRPENCAGHAAVQWRGHLAGVGWVCFSMYSRATEIDKAEAAAAGVFLLLQKRNTCCS